jgi:hypothetical protein
VLIRRTNRQGRILHQRRRATVVVDLQVGRRSASFESGCECRRNALQNGDRCCAFIRLCGPRAYPHDAAAVPAARRSRRQAAENGRMPAMRSRVISRICSHPQATRRRGSSRSGAPPRRRTEVVPRVRRRASNG